MVTTRTIGMKSSASQALPAPTALAAKTPLPPETSTVNQSKNMKMKSSTDETPATFSPLLSLSRSIGASLRRSLAGRPDPISASAYSRAEWPTLLSRARQGPRTRGLQGVDQQHRDRHRPDAAGNRRDRRRRRGRLEVDVAAEAVLAAVHADVDDAAPRLAR